MNFPNPLALLASWFRHKVADARGYVTIAPGAVQAGRNGHCELCIHSDGFACDVCNCLIIAKVSLAQEKCPIGKWDRVYILKN